MTAQPDPGRTEVLPEGMGRTTRIAATIFVIVAVAFWIFAFSPWARDIFQAPDQIQDDAYNAAIEDRCALTVAQIEGFPSVRSATGPEDRADNVELVNGALLQLRSDLAELDGGTPEDRVLIGRWLDDWDFYIQDRIDHVQRLRTEGDVRFLNTERDGIFIAERMNGFARVNEIRSCLPPGDL